jgi:hypothetical protein
MFLRAEQPLGGSGQCFLRYRHTPNLLRLRKQLLAAGISRSADFLSGLYA